MAQGTREANKKRIPKKQKPLRSLVLAFVFTCLVIYLGVSAFETALKIKDTKEKINVAKSEYQQLVDANKNTENLLKNADENDIIERIARERLGYVFPDEKVFQDVN